MGFSSGSVSFKRFYVNGPAPQRVDETLIKQIAARSINADRIQTADHTEIGWTTGRHILDTDFNLASNAIADGLYFALRIDTNKPPAELVRSYQKLNEDAMLEASGREYLSKPQRREAREQALAKAEAEARSGAFRRMKQVPVFWDLERNQVYFGTTSPAAADHFAVLFRQTFDRAVVAASSGEMAGRWAASAGDARAFDGCRPAFFVNPPDGVEDADELSGNAAEARSRDFLGTEWLTWLWFTSHVESPEISTPNGLSVAVFFEKSIQLECAFKITGSTAIRADGPTRLPEATVALATGKRPVRAGLQIAVHGDVFSFALRGDAMNLSAVQLPPTDDAGNPRVVFEDRLGKLRDLLDAIDQLYAVFLKRRLSSKWPQTLGAMRNWIAAGARAGDVAGESSPPAIPAVAS